MVVEQQEQNDNVLVAVRSRPFVAKEKLEHCQNCIRFFPESKQIVIGKDRGFNFDFSFDGDTPQEQVYDACCSQLVSGCFEGYNGTVFAYGQTGSGKTFTMGTACTTETVSGDENAADLGIIPRAVAHIWDTMAVRNKQGEIVSISVEMLEIYNEEVRDLLHPETPAKAIAVRETPDGGIRVMGVRAESVLTMQQVFKHLENGAAARTTGSTLMNEHSSRSHAIFSLLVEHQLSKFDDVTRAKLHLVDLAGSERAKKTGAVGVRFAESVHINQGLLALGNVISALGDHARGRNNRTHIPYRDSKLTRMLQDSLGGNARTCMLACVSPADSCFEETLNTLKYASRARNIKNKPVVNHLLADDGAARAAAQALAEEEMGRMRREVEALQEQLQQAHQAQPPPPPPPQQQQLEQLEDGAAGAVGTGSSELCRLVRELQQEVARLREQLTEAREDLERDEEIFAVKTQELGQYKRRLMRLHDEHQVIDRRPRATRAAHPLMLHTNRSKHAAPGGQAAAEGAGGGGGAAE